MDTEKQRQRRRDDARLTESGNARNELLNTRSAYRVAKPTEFGLPEWIRTSKAWLVFRYKISDLFLWPGNEANEELECTRVTRVTLELVHSSTQAHTCTCIALAR